MAKLFLLATAAFMPLFFCSRSVEFPRMDYTTDINRKLPDWECHQVFAFCKDSLTGRSFLEVTAFPKKKYPGIVLPWLEGGWDKFASFHIIARVSGARDSVSFYLSIWDGNAPYSVDNRFEKKFMVRGQWTDCAVSLKEGFVTPSGRAIDKKDIRQVVFFTSHRADPVVFDVASIALR